MPEKKRKQQSFEYGAIILLCSTFLVKIIGAVFKIPLSRLWEDELGFGYFSSAYALFTPIYSLAMAGLPIAISRFVANSVQQGKYNDVKSALKVTKKLFTITGITGFILMLALSYPFVLLTDKSGATIYSIIAIAPALFFCCIMSVYRGYYEGLRNMYPTAISDIIEALGKLILGLLFAYLVMHYTQNIALSAAAAMLGIVVGGAASATFLILRYKFKGDGITDNELLNAPKAQDDKAIAKTILAIAIPVVLASLANTVSSFVDVFLVKWQLTEMMNGHFESIKNLYDNCITSNITAEQLPTYLYGVREKAFTLYNLIPTITSVLGVSALPVLATAYTKKDNSLLKRNIESGMKLTAIISMPVGMGFVFLGPAIMKLMYNTAASVEIGGVMLCIYGLAAIFAGLAIPMISMLQAIGKEKISLRNVAIGAAIKVIVNFIFVGIPTINIKGAAIGTFVSYFFIFIANLLSLIKYTAVVPNVFKTLIKPFIAAFSCGVIAMLCYKILNGGSIMTVLSIMVAAVVYLISLVFLNTFEEEDFITLPKGGKIVKLCKKFKIIR
ncbi:MAG: polysaccharide biosynthesis protein [Clostridia bacterium]|nr:polysaccharide biosynthesis protein [Clostridia bacterium]